MEFNFESVLIEWRGPAPFVFAPLPEDDSTAIKVLASQASYGWGCIPVRAQIGRTAFTTSLMPKDGRYLLPIKVAVQKAEAVLVGQMISARIEIAIHR